MKLAIMQPYFFPYLGYFQLINSVDKFILYDDVNFIKNGWINRNKIIINNSAKYITLQLKGASSNKLINEVEFTDNRNKIKKAITLAYKKAPYFEALEPLIKEILSLDTKKVSEQASYSIKKISNYLDIDTVFEISSEKYSNAIGLDRVERLISICKKNQATTYINPIGGQELYQKKIFQEVNVELSFLKPGLNKYEQFSKTFIPGLSIIDVMMFNSPGNIRKMLDNYELI